LRNFIKKNLIFIEKLSFGRFDAEVLKYKIKKSIEIYKIEKVIFFIIDLILFPITFLSTIFLKFIRALGIRYLNFSKFTFDKLKVYPIIDHYYEPFFNSKKLRKPLSQDRVLDGIDFNTDEQLRILSYFDYNDELLALPKNKKDSFSFSYDGGSFPRGDSEYYYSIIRHFKPKNIIEIGSGKSTLMALNAIRKNRICNDAYECKMTCIEPFEQRWLKNLNEIVFLNEKVENIDFSLFKSLCNNDILFIDSSHLIKPQGDVVFEYLEILPKLNPGVMIHIHDIFTPKDYPYEWLIDNRIFWNEQYILEAFLMFNKNFKIIGALNFLANNYTDMFLNKSPVLKEYLNGKPVGYSLGSFWLQKL